MYELVTFGVLNLAHLMYKLVAFGVLNLVHLMYKLDAFDVPKSVHLMYKLVTVRSIGEGLHALSGAPMRLFYYVILFLSTLQNKNNTGVSLDQGVTPMLFRSWQLLGLRNYVDLC